MSYPVPSPGEVWAFRPILPRRLLVEIDEFDRDADLVRFHYCTTGRDIELPLTRFVQHYVPSVERWKIIGNAVCPPVGRAVLATVLEQSEGDQSEGSDR